MIIALSAENDYSSATVLSQRGLTLNQAPGAATMNLPRRTLPFLSAAVLLFGGVLSPASAFGQDVDRASRVRILLVVDTFAERADTLGVSPCGECMKKVLKEGLREQGLEDRYTLDVLRGPEATPAKVLDYYRHLRSAASEALVFYYIGHGGADKSRGHFLDMKAGRLFRSELLETMQAHHTRLVVILTDCCANYGGLSGLPAIEKLPRGTTPKVAGPLARENQAKRSRGETVQALLFAQTGVVDITACEIGKVALADRHKGGYFSLTLARLLSEDSSHLLDDTGRVNWTSFFGLLQRRTEEAAGSDPHDPIAQRPHAFKLTRAAR
jgi:hypothetical protein